MRAKQKMPREGGISCDWSGSGWLDAYAELAGLRLAGVGVKVVGRTLLELGAAAQLNAEIDAECSDGHADREPANELAGPSSPSSASSLGFFGGHQGFGFVRHDEDCLLHNHDTPD